HAQRNAESVGRQGPRPLRFGKIVRNQGIGRGHPARLADAHAHPAQEQRAEAARHAAQGGEAGPDGQGAGHDPHPAEAVRQPGDGDRQGRIQQGESQAAQQAELSVAEVELRLQRRGQDADDLPVQEVQHIDEDQDPQHIVAIARRSGAGVDRRCFGLGRSDLTHDVPRLVLAVQADGPLVAGVRPDDRQVDEGEGVLIQHRIGELELAIGVAVADRGRHRQRAAGHFAEPRQAEVAGPLGRILQHDQVGDILVLLGGQVVAQELLELGVQVADGEVGRQAVGQDQRAFNLGAVELGRTDVVHEAGDAAHGRNLGGDLLVLIVVVEDRRGEAQTAIEGRALQADFIRIDRLRLIAVDRVRRQDGVAAHVEAARLEALGVGGVAGNAVREVIGQRGLGRELIEAVRARIVGAQQDRIAGRPAEQRAARRTQIVGAEDVPGLVVERIARAQTQVQAIGQVQVDVGEEGDAGRLHIAGRTDDDAEVLGNGVEGARGGA
uniref:LigA n=1 Tax=Parastrongyloides trichosuri TaxID=131310 RepID=A0A0N4ZGW3_PARTI